MQQSAADGAGSNTNNTINNSNNSNKSFTDNRGRRCRHERVQGFASRSDKPLYKRHRVDSSMEARKTGTCACLDKTKVNKPRTLNKEPDAIGEVEGAALGEERARIVGLCGGSTASIGGWRGSRHTCAVTGFRVLQKLVQLQMQHG